MDGNGGRLSGGRLASVEAGVAVLDASDDESWDESAEAVSEQEVSFRRLGALEKNYLEND